MTRADDPALPTVLEKEGRLIAGVAGPRCAFWVNQACKSAPTGGVAAAGRRPVIFGEGEITFGYAPVPTGCGAECFFMGPARDGRGGMSQDTLDGRQSMMAGKNEV